MDSTSATAVCLSGALIFTTIQAQDFADVEGDSISGRKTFPIYAPEFSRIATVAAMSAWSVFLASFWGIGTLCGAIFVGFGSFVGSRYYFLRRADDDQLSYVLYNVSFVCILHRDDPFDTSRRTTDLVDDGTHHVESCSDGAVRILI